MWWNPTPGTPIWLLKDSGNSEVLTKIAEKVFKHFSKLGETNQAKPTKETNKKPPSGNREANIRTKKWRHQVEKLCLHHCEGGVTRENGRWEGSQICPMFTWLSAGQSANCLNTDNEEGHTSNQGWLHKILEMLLATVETMVPDFLSEWTMWSLEKLQGAPRYTAVSLNWIELDEYSLNRYFRIYMNELSKIATC